MDAITERPAAAIRTRWAAIGAAVAAAGAVGIGGWGLVRAATPAPPAAYQAVTPCRLVDTRPAPDNVGPRTVPLGPADTFTTDGWGANGNCDLPSGTTALAVNATAVGASAPTYLTFFPAGIERPKSSSLNPFPGEPPTPNAVNITLAADGRFSVFNLAGTVDLVIDVVGVYTPGGSDEASVTLDAYTQFVVSTSDAVEPRLSNNSYCVRATPEFDGLPASGGLWASVPLPAGSVLNSIVVHTTSDTAQPFTISASVIGDPSRSLIPSGAQPRTSGPGKTSLTISPTDTTPIADGETVRLFFHSWVASSSAHLCGVTVHYTQPG